MRLPFSRLSKPAAQRPRAASGIDEPAAIAQARTRARQRLAGAGVLLVIGVVGFPILFETQPRPLPMDTPILQTRSEPLATEKPAPPPRPTAAALPALPPADAGVEAAPAAPTSKPEVSAASSAPTSSPASSPTNVPASLPGRAPARAPAAAAALLVAAPLPAAAAGSEPAAASTANRFVVQVGAFTDANALREVRQRVEKLGFKTYTQVIESDAGARTRVRIGPYATREEADAASTKLKRAGLTPNVLAL